MNVKSLLFFSIVILILNGCATPEPKKAPKQANDTQQQLESVEEKPVSVEDLLAQAKTEDNEDAIILLLQAGQKLLKQEQSEKSLFLSQQLSNLPLNQIQSNYNLLNMAEASLMLDDPTLCLSLLSQIKASSTAKRKLRLTADALLAQGKLPQAIIAYLEQYNLYPSDDIEELQKLEQLVGQLMPWQVDFLEKQNPPELAGWLELSEILAATNPESTQKDNLQRWQNRHTAHSAMPLVESKYQPVFILQSTTPVQTQESDVAGLIDEMNGKGADTKIENITVIIPLSGREASIGESIQHGLLAAYQKNDNTRQLTFIDSNSTPMTDITQSLMLTPPDFVIGPLLKQNVDAYLATEQVLMPHTWPTLLLNLPEQQMLGEQHYVFSMRPEDEAKQSAFTLYHKGYQHPVILSQDSSLGKRLADTFQNQWFQQSGSKPQVIYYQTSKEMELAVKSALDVNLSKERIFLMRNRMNENLKAEPRNRRDIDMIYIFASADDARLLKPYVDVNISPFAQAIPIFASSRSHNINRDKNTSRDLNGLTFTEIPWLLPNEARDKQLAEQAQQLWPTTTSVMQRLYAMGIDSMNLVDKVQLMAQNPAQRHNGETGTLQMDSDRIISRSLSWGKYGFRQVTTTSME
ncbi:penicillin-binding protein activator [Thalassotalea litorea]|uniref:Penicillin-binding protein activator n=1 Tax=Thalassotalea litorea TaxID=2020715 RepID=A0A5R9IQ28_9GAMM|nr:penicillin-binding protein activator [Thalassotalea litorea]TLU66709.1 penicillin-binding protein activator [Thalassotalea litorea]